MKKAMTIVYEVGNNLYVNITNKCPCKCIFCIRNNGDGAYGSDSLWLEREPSAEEIISTLKKVDFKKYSEIIYCGYGEPTERIDVLVETARFIKENGGPPVRINTNGLSDIINGRPTACLLEGAADTVSVSLNAGTKEEYLRVTQPLFGEVAYEAMQKFALECKQYVKNVMFTVVDIIGEEQIKAAQEMADKLGIRLRIRKYES